VGTRASGLGFIWGRGPKAAGYRCGTAPDLHRTSPTARGVQACRPGPAARTPQVLGVLGRRLQPLGPYVNHRGRLGEQGRGKPSSLLAPLLPGAPLGWELQKNPPKAPTAASRSGPLCKWEQVSLLISQNPTGILDFCTPLPYPADQEVKGVRGHEPRPREAGVPRGL
jgi:hypothetical protein